MLTTSQNKKYNPAHSVKLMWFELQMNSLITHKSQLVIFRDTMFMFYLQNRAIAWKNRR